MCHVGTSPSSVGDGISFGAAISACNESIGHWERFNSQDLTNTGCVADFNPQELANTDVVKGPSQGTDISFNAAISACNESGHRERFNSQDLGNTD
eukprot:2171590-Karenia_brevis.AAC.1